MKLLSFKVGTYDIVSPGGIPHGDPGFLGSNLITLGMDILLFTAVVLSLLFLLWGGISWILSGGDKNGIEAARAKITYAIIGLVLTFAAFLIISFIGYLFNVNLLSNPNMLNGTTT